MFKNCRDLLMLNRFPWRTVKCFMMTTEYCPATESKGWSKSLVLVTLKGDDIEHTTIRFTNWVLMYPELVSTEKKRFEKLIIRGDFPEESKENAPDKGFEGYTGNLPWKGSVELGFHSCSRRQFATKCDMLGGRKQGLLQEWE
ncbi:hypothetical protein Tco_0568582 [Tanacetum coccineum]